MPLRGCRRNGWHGRRAFYGPGFGPRWVGPPPRRGLNPATTMLLLAAGAAVAYGSYKYITYKRRVQKVTIVNGRQQTIIVDELCDQNAPGAMQVLVDEHGNPAPPQKQPCGYRPPTEPPAGYIAGTATTAQPTTASYSATPAPPGYPIPPGYPQQSVATGYPAAIQPVTYTAATAPYSSSSAMYNSSPPPDGVHIYAAPPTV